MNKEITFNVKEQLEKKIELNANVASLAHKFFNVKISNKELTKKVTNEAKKDMDYIFKCLKKSYKEIKENKEKIDKVNCMLENLNSNIRLKQYITITDGLKLSENTYLCGNNYFKKIFSNHIDNIIIPSLNYTNLELTEEEKKEELKDLSKDNLYYDGDGCEYIISLIDNFDDEIDYDKNYLDVVLQVLDKNKKLLVRNDFEDCIDFYTGDENIEFDIDTSELIDIFLVMNGNKKIERKINKYSITIDQLENLIKQIN